MIETLTTSSEQQQDPERLATGDALRAIYSAKFAEMELPTEYQMPQDYRYGDQVFSISDAASPMSAEEVHQEFITQATREAYAGSWWVSVSKTLKNYAADPAQAHDIQLAAKHTLDIVYDGKPTDQRYEVFEIGEAEPDPAASAIIFDTLKLIDQASGGALAANPNRPRVILSNGIRMVENPNGEGEALGFADPSIVLINTSGLRDVAERNGTNFHELLAVTTVHELLGHGLERAVMQNTGRYFPQYFNYSSAHTSGEMFNQVHDTIEPKDAVHAGSQPVREYGRVSPSDDLATSVDAVVGKAMGWDKSTDKYPRMRSETDAYRRDLVMQLMDTAADNASKYDANPGIVGSEIRYLTDDAGKVVGVEPARKLETTTTSGPEAIKQEIDAQVQKQKPNGIFVIYDEDIM